MLAGERGIVAFYISKNNQKGKVSQLLYLNVAIQRCPRDIQRFANIIYGVGCIIIE
jgi:hypothetical protein